MAVTLVCPFCDEPAGVKIGNKKIVSPGKIYTLRECSMGHQVYSVEYIPENQSRVVDEINAIKEYKNECRLKAMRERARAKAKEKKPKRKKKRVSSI